MLRRSNFRTGTRWGETCKALGVPGLHLHDLRHTGNTLAAQTGTSLRDLMTRMGHESPRAALIYQHASSGADRPIADALDLLSAATEEPADKPSTEHDQVDEGTGQNIDLAGEWHADGTFGLASPQLETANSEDGASDLAVFWVETRGIEPRTSCLQSRRSTN